MCSFTNALIYFVISTLWLVLNKWMWKSLLIFKFNVSFHNVFQFNLLFLHFDSCQLMECENGFLFQFGVYSFTSILIYFVVSTFRLVLNNGMCKSGFIFQFGMYSFTSVLIYFVVSTFWLVLDNGIWKSFFIFKFGMYTSTNVLIYFLISTLWLMLNNGMWKSVFIFEFDMYSFKSVSIYFVIFIFLVVLNNRVWKSVLYFSLVCIDSQMFQFTLLFLHFDWCWIIECETRFLYSNMVYTVSLVF